MCSTLSNLRQMLRIMQKPVRNHSICLLQVSPLASAGAGDRTDSAGAGAGRCSLGVFAALLLTGWVHSSVAARAMYGCDKVPALLKSIAR